MIEQQFKDLFIAALNWQFSLLERNKAIHREHVYDDYVRSNFDYERLKIRAILNNIIADMDRKS